MAFALYAVEAWLKDLGWMQPFGVCHSETGRPVATRGLSYNDRVSFRVYEHQDEKVSSSLCCIIDGDDMFACGNSFAQAGGAKAGHVQNCQLGKSVTHDGPLETNIPESAGAPLAGEPLD